MTTDYDALSTDRTTLSRLLGYMLGGDNRAKTALATASRVVAILGLAALPWITGQAMNVMNDPSGTTDQLNRWVIAGFVAGVVYLGFSFLSDRLFSRLATNALYRLQTKLFSHMQTLSMGFFFTNPVGQLTSRITNDSEVVALFYEQGVGPIIRAIDRRDSKIASHFEAAEMKEKEATENAEALERETREFRQQRGKSALMKF